MIVGKRCVMPVELSIIVPAYNVAAYLEPCIESIMAGTYQNFELLLVDDGSTDGTGTLCDQLAEKYSKIKVFHTENRGLSMARNLGIDHAVGKYIGFVDSDDMILPEMYEKLVSAMTEDVQLVCCRFLKCRREAVSPPVLSGYSSVHSGDSIANQIVCNYYGAYAWSKLYRRELLDQNGIRFKPGYIMEDQYFIADYLQVCGKAVFLDDALYYYIDTEGSILNRFRHATAVAHKYMHMPRSWVYFSDAVAHSKHVCAEAKMRAAMNYQSVLRKLEPEDMAFTAEAVRYVRKNNHLLLRHKWGFPYFISGCILCMNYRLWKCIFRRTK